MDKARVLVASLSITAATLVGIASYEGYTDQAIQPIPGDSWTYGFGETDGVKKGDRTTPVRALVRLLDSTEKHADGIKKCLDGASLYPHEFQAYLSLSYNIGVGAFCRGSIPVKVKAQQYQQACETILLYNKAGGKVIQGLVNRRQSEYKICIGE